jgi:hypothetical protein
MSQKPVTMVLQVKKENNLSNYIDNFRDKAA